MDWSAAGIAFALIVLIGVGIGVRSRLDRRSTEPDLAPTFDEKVRAHRRSKYRNAPGMSGFAGGLFGSGVWAGGDSVDGGGFDGAGGGDGGGG